MSNQAEVRNCSVLGSAVHPAALKRLHELFPAARVNVEHESMPRELPHGSMKMGQRHYHEPERATRVYIDLDGALRPGGTIFAASVCHPEDNFDRRKGISMAFRRALDIARRNSKQRRWEAAQLTQGIYGADARHAGTRI